MFKALDERIEDHIFSWKQTVNLFGLRSSGVGRNHLRSGLRCFLWSWSEGGPDLS